MALEKLITSTNGNISSVVVTDGEGNPVGNWDALIGVWTLDPAPQVETTFNFTIMKEGCPDPIVKKIVCPAAPAVEKCSLLWTADIVEKVFIDLGDGNGQQEIVPPNGGTGWHNGASGPAYFGYEDPALGLVKTVEDFLAANGATGTIIVGGFSPFPQLFELENFSGVSVMFEALGAGPNGSKKFFQCCGGSYKLVYDVSGSSLPDSIGGACGGWSVGGTNVLAGLPANCSTIVTSTADLAAIMNTNDPNGNTWTVVGDTIEGVVSDVTEYGRISTKDFNQLFTYPVLACQ